MKVQTLLRNKKQCINKFLFFLQKRERKYIPFYETRKEKKKGKAEKDTKEAKENEEKKNSETEKENDKERTSWKYAKMFMPCISPYKGLKLIQCFKTTNNELMKQTEEINFNLLVRIDIKRESLRGMCALSHSVDKNKKILVLVEEEEHKHLKNYGADYIGLEYINRIQNGWLNFHICITNFKNINKILPIAKILGPKKLMPNIKSGTLVDNLEETIKKIKSGNIIEYRTESIQPSAFELYKHLYNWETVEPNSVANISVNLANTDMPFYHILENMKSFVSEIIKNNPHSGQIDKGSKPSFVWPPVTSKKKKKVFTTNILNTMEDEEAFVLGGFINFNNFPKLFLNPNLLLPISNGYSR